MNASKEHRQKDDKQLTNSFYFLHMLFDLITFIPIFFTWLFLYFVVFVYIAFSWLLPSMPVDQSRFMMFMQMDCFGREIPMMGENSRTFQRAYPFCNIRERYNFVCLDSVEHRKSASRAEFWIWLESKNEDGIIVEAGALQIATHIPSEKYKRVYYPNKYFELSTLRQSNNFADEFKSNKCVTKIYKELQ